MQVTAGCDGVFFFVFASQEQLQSIIFVKQTRELWCRFRIKCWLSKPEHICDLFIHGTKSTSRVTAGQCTRSPTSELSRV